MMKRRAFLLFAMSLPLAKAWAQSAPPQRLPSDEEIHEILRSQFSNEGTASGFVTSLVETRGRRLVTYGRSDSADGRPLDGDTVFEIASITKIFTALLLADMVEKREVRLSDPVGKYLPHGVKTPTFEGRSITLLDLATYSSGLPGLPSNGDPKAAMPFANYAPNDLYAFLASYELRAVPGTTYAYSNVGYGLLGHVLSLKAGVSLEELIVSRICAPLGLESTRITPTNSMKARLAPGHGRDLHQLPHFVIGPALAGGGALLSTANDLSTLLEALMGIRKTRLAPTFATLLKVRRPADEPETKVGAGWFISTEYDDEVVFKDGNIPGYSSFMGYSTHSHAGVVFLSNASIGPRNNQVGKHFLNMSYPLPKV